MADKANMETKTKTCSYCLEEIPDSALTCRHCGELLEDSGVHGQSSGREKNGAVLSFFEDMNVAPLPALILPLLLALMVISTSFL